MTLDTYSGLLDRFADNGQRAIGADDVRVLLDSVFGGSAIVSLRTPAATQFAGVGAFVVSAGVTAIGPAPRLLESPASFTLRYTGSVPAVAYACATYSIRSASPNQLSLARFSINGSVSSQESVDSEIERYIANNDAGAAAVRGVFILAPGDEVALAIANGTSTANFTITRCTMQVQARIL